MLATATWDGSTDGDGDGINWHDPLNWESNTRPGTNDDVVVGIDFTGDTVRVSSIVSDTVRSIDSEAELLIDGGTLRVAADSRVAALTIDAGIGFLGVNRTERLDVDGTMNWIGPSNLGSFGEVHVYGPLTISGSGERRLGNALHSHDTAIWTGASMHATGHFYNHGTLTTMTNTFFGGFGQGHLFNLPGATLIHDADGDGDDFMDLGFLVNDGTVEVQRGKLASNAVISNGNQAWTNHGVYQVSPGAEFQFAGIQTLAEDAVVNSSGTLTMAGSLVVDGTINATGPMKVKH